MTIDEANAELCRHRNLALIKYANDLIADGADVDDDEFRRKMLRYARSLEFWRTASMSRIKQVINAARIQRDQSAAVH
jgi:hypothetical protein